MDPALQEFLVETTDPEEELEGIARLTKAGQYPPGLRVVSEFGEIITCRIARKNIEALYQHPAIASLKAPRIFYGQHLTCDCIDEATEHFNCDALAEDYAATYSGKGVVIGIIDWGCDFAHADFINPGNTTRLIALWDQEAPAGKDSPWPYQYGKLYTRDQINAALQSATPYQTLGYHPGRSDRNNKGMHGTHVMGIATGNGSSGKTGIAPGAEIIFVHLGASDLPGIYNLGDSCRILEAVDFIRKTAGDKPLVINLSVGKHGGPHDGTTLVEMALDNFLEQQCSTVLCQSTGNYFQTHTHVSGLVKPGRREQLVFSIDKADVTPNEVEIWYPGKDVFTLSLQNKSTKAFCALGSSADIVIKGELVGRMYHRAHDPNNARNHIDIFLYPQAPPGEWTIELGGLRICDGRFDAWIERDGGCPHCQCVFITPDTNHTATTNTICNGYHTIVVGAFETTAAGPRIASFSSSGPTVDGRIKPGILAPGIKITAARSARRESVKGSNELMQLSGTSMASPHVTGAVAWILEGIPKKLTIHQVKNILFASCRDIPVPDADKNRCGYGILDLEQLGETIKKLQ